MTCTDTERLLSKALDGAADPREQAALEAHLAACPHCAALREEWLRYRAFLQEPVAPAQTAEALWADVQRAIRLQGDRSDEDAPVFGWRLRWAGAIIAVVLLGAYGVGLGLRQQAGRVVEAAASDKAAQVEFVETDVPGASPLVYEDAETGLTVIWVAGMEGTPESPQGS
jgi:anti-sigma factor RsiW